jgi:pimeloyl-ACP methyl ester carboxylesterase
MAAQDSIERVIEQHRNSGRFFTAGGVRSFALDYGTGEPVVCMHGVPTSSFLYRKVIRELASQGLRGISFDFPGLGLADRPEEFDYSFSGLASFSGAAVDALGLDSFHLVVHDIGGPVGFAMAADMPERIKSITILNTWVNVEDFTKPLPMRPFELPVLGEAELALVNHATWSFAFSSVAVADATGIPEEEVEAYIDLLKREDGGKAFLKIMRNFDHSPAFRERCYRAVQNVPYPLQAIWGVQDPGLKYEEYGKEIQDVARLPYIHQVAGKHLLQEDHWKFIALQIAELAGTGSRSLEAGAGR